MALNRELQRKNSRRTMSRKRGGGYGMGAPLVSIPSGPGSDWNFAVKQPINQGFDDCLFPARPGELFNQPNPGLAQAAWPLKGGRRRRGSRRGHGRRRFQRGGNIEENDIEVGKEVVDIFNNNMKYTITGKENDQVMIMADGVTETVPVTEFTQSDRFRFADDSNASTAPLMGNTTSSNGNGEMPSEAVGPAPRRGGSRDANEISHAYPDDGWHYADKVNSSAGITYGPGSGLAQTVMAGGGGAGSSEPSPFIHPSGWSTPSLHGGQPPQWGPNTGLVQTSMAGGRRRRRGSQRRRRTQRGGGCGCSGGSKLFGGVRRSTRRMRGGASNGYAVIPSLTIGGNGPNVAALHAGVPCDARAGTPNPYNPESGASDPRAYGVGYSLTPNSTTPSLQAGGAYASGNAYPASCYRAPGSELPVYEAQTAGFNFYPSTASNGALPDGVTPYNDVVPYAARMGGGRRRKSRRGRRASRRGSRKH
jgi:hypothetical protein